VLFTQTPDTHTHVLNMAAAAYVGQNYYALSAVKKYTLHSGKLARPKIVADIAAALQATTTLQELTILPNVGRAAYWATICTALAVNTSIRHLDVSTNCWEGDVTDLMTLLVPVVMSNTTMVSLRVSPHEAPIVPAMITALGINTTLEKLTLTRSSLTVEDLQTIFATNATLKVLDLSFSRPMTIPRPPPTLRVLSLRRVRLTNFFEVLAMSTLDEIDVHSVASREAELYIAEPVLVRKVTLEAGFSPVGASENALLLVEDLTLDSVDITPSLTIAISRAVQRGRLHTLTLTCVTISEGIMATLALAIKHATTLRELTFDALCAPCPSYSQWWTALSKAVGSSTTLQRLVIRCSTDGISNSQFCTIFRCPTLTALELSGKHLDLRQCDALLAQSVRRLTSLVINKLRLPVQMPDFMEAVNTTRTLKHLQITPRRMYAGIMEQLISSASPTVESMILPRCTTSVVASLHQNLRLQSIDFIDSPTLGTVGPLIARNIRWKVNREAFYKAVLCARRMRLSRLPAEIWAMIWRFNTP